MEKLYFYEENYDDMLINSKYVACGTESTILFHDGKIYKLLVPEAINKFIKKRLRYISEKKELEDYITMPLREIYYEFRFIGYEMDYAGCNLTDFLIECIDNDSLDNNLKYELLSKMKLCIEKIHEYKMIHGDIQPRNVLVNNDKVLLGDINNMNFGIHRNAYLNEISLRLCRKYGVSPIIDIQSFNYFCYFIFNADNETLRDILSYGADSIFRTGLLEVDNKCFDDKVIQEQKEIFDRKRSKKLALTESKYLIDYLK